MHTGLQAEGKRARSTERQDLIHSCNSSPHRPWEEVSASVVPLRDLISSPPLVTDHVENWARWGCAPGPVGDVLCLGSGVGGGGDLPGSWSPRSRGTPRKPAPERF